MQNAISNKIMFGTTLSHIFHIKYFVPKVFSNLKLYHHHLIFANFIYVYTLYNIYYTLYTQINLLILQCYNNDINCIINIF